MQPISSHDVLWTEWSDVPGFGVRYRHLSRAMMGDGYRVGVAIEELAPGRQSAPAHYHLFEEEHVYVLEGTLTARIGLQAYQMGAGDYVCFPAGQRAGHCLINNSNAICRYVIVGENKPAEVVSYPDSDKIMVRDAGRRLILDRAATRGYWDGEVTGLSESDVPPCRAEDNAPETAIVPKPPISSEALAWDNEGESPRLRGRSKHLTHAAVGPHYHVGMLIEAPAPGMRLAPRHYHMLEEEHALILEGEVTLLLGDERCKMKAGDYACFPAGRPVGHSFVNSGEGLCRYLMIGEKNPNDVCVYPDSNKMAVGALRSKGRLAIFDMAATRNYWDGEEV